MIESPLLEKLTGYIGGRWTDNEQGSTFDVYNPATGQVIAQVASMSESEVKAAVDAGKSALRLTSPYSIETRRKWLEDIRDALKSNKEEVGRILCLEHGKPLNEAQGEVDYAAGCFAYCSRHIQALDAHTLPENP
jgi:succinate-semialdehyde dehydrogenase/glutarate-semialdehyde dehydrogenase